jgi:NAD(P)H-nitrite reductase large subunit
MDGNDIYLCRCECVTAAAVDEAITEGNLTINDVKRRTRAGMGICQGIYCVGEIADKLMAAGVNADAIEPMTARPPTRLVPVGIAAALAPEPDA